MSQLHQAGSLQSHTPNIDADNRRRELLKRTNHKHPVKWQHEYKAGKKAYWKGRGINANPYPPGSLSEELWDQGWHAAELCDAQNPKVAEAIKASVRIRR